MQIALAIGDQIARPKINGLVDHVGIVVAPNVVFHNSPERGEHVSTVRDFAGNKPIRIVDRHANTKTWQATRTRIDHQLTSPRAYALTSYNCEHSVSHALGHPPHSKQLQAWLAVIGLGTLLVLACRGR